MNMDQDILLQMTDIMKTFPGVKALDHVSLTLKRGTVHALMGENGAEMCIRDRSEQAHHADGPCKDCAAARSLPARRIRH